ncbi:peptidylprolyl isomerase [Deferribacter abyssi]|uniref:peptidylprolyl isomerase n=1 Tax=Deferribacter abyssi TaxID=213806 RepID=UPI003C2DC9AB
MKKVLFLVFLLLMIAASLVMAENKIIAKVNGSPIYESEVNAVFAEILLKNGIAPNSVDFNNPQFREIKEKIVDQLIDREVLAQHSEKFSYKNIEKDIKTKLSELKSSFNNEKEFQDALKRNNLTEQELKNKIRKNILVRKQIDAIKSNIKVTEVEKKEFYNKNINKFKTPDSVHVKHIIILTGKKRSDIDAKKLINEIYNKINKGESFEDLAKKYSEDASAQNGGDLGFITKGKTVPEFEKIAFTTKTGKVSKPFKSKFGYHILKVIENKKGKTLTYEEVKKQISQLIVDNKLENIIKDKIRKWRKNDKIEKYL